MCSIFLFKYYIFCNLQITGYPALIIFPLVAEIFDVNFTLTVCVRTEAPWIVLTKLDEKDKQIGSFFYLLYFPSIKISSVVSFHEPRVRRKLKSVSSKLLLISFFFVLSFVAPSSVQPTAI